jgi:hypothetical protein
MDEPPVNDLLSLVKSRQIQRAMLAEMRKDTDAAVRHFLAAAHLEIVLAADFRAVNRDDQSLRSLISAASCFWRAGRVAEAERVFDEVNQTFPAQADTVRQLREELTRDYPAKAS